MTRSKVRRQQWTGTGLFHGLLGMVAWMHGDLEGTSVPNRRNSQHGDPETAGERRLGSLTGVQMRHRRTGQGLAGPGGHEMDSSLAQGGE